MDCVLHRIFSSEFVPQKFNLKYFVKRIIVHFQNLLVLFWSKLKQMKQSEVVIIFDLLCCDFTGPTLLGIDFPPCGT